ncbi:MAG: MFS transporter [bacterium]|nr:MFS transporter [bacterium]
MAQHNQFQLLKERRFLPFFITQFLGAFNDNVFKNALIILLAFKGAKELKMDSNLLVNAAAVLFILPFFLFSATSGQLADKFEKSASIRRIKLFEIFIMFFAAIGFYLNNMMLLLVVLFFMGFQSTLFGPIKYGILPQHLEDDELVGGNGLIETGTFLAILLGTMLGGALIAVEQLGSKFVAYVVICLAILGYFSSRYIPLSSAVAPELKINLNPVSETIRNFSYMRSHKTIFLSVLGISWFWFYGAMFLAQIPNYTQFTLGGTEEVATVLLTAFSLGIGIGSLFCEKLSGHRVETGLVPLGAIGLTVFAIDLYFVSPGADAQPTLGAMAFLATWGNWHVLLDAMFIGVFGGFFIVPLYALIQERCESSHLSRVIAGNNILNALFMVVSGITAMVILSNGFNIPELFMITALINALVSIYIFSLVPEFILRFVAWILINTLYRIQKKELANIPHKGACVLVCNHVSFVDALIIMGYCHRPVRFVMDHRIYHTPIIHWFFRLSGVVPIASAREDEALMESAFDKIANYLVHDEVVCIFPEGRLTPDGDIGDFRPGIERIVNTTPVPVIPMALQGLWGSFFSRYKGKAMSGIPRKLWAKIGLVAGPAVEPNQVSADVLQQRVMELRGDQS